MEPTPEMFHSLKDTFQSMTDLQTVVQALQDAEVFRRKHGDFAQEIAMRAAIDPKTSPCKINSVQPLLFPLLQISNSLVNNSIPLSHAYAASWWMMFGSSTPALQKLAFRLVSQCVSSSGCERNWSTFALLHTKVRNWLTHKKLNKLVYVNYNLRLRLKELNNPPRDEGGFMDHLAHLTFYDEHNPVREWMEYGRSNEAPVLDEDDDDDGDVPLPSHIVRDHIDPSALRDATGDECISDWARRTVGNTHLGKRKFQKGPQKDDSKHQRKAIPVSSDTSTDDGDGQRSHRIRRVRIAARLKMVMIVTVTVVVVVVVVVLTVLVVVVVVVAVVVVMVVVVVVVAVFVSQVSIAFAPTYDICFKLLSTNYGSLQGRLISHMLLRTKTMDNRNRRGERFDPLTTTLLSTLLPRTVSVTPHSLLCIPCLTLACSH
jgi:hypothetical protein